MPGAATEPIRETSAFWRHARFPDLGLIRARFVRHRYDLHTHPTYVIALITQGCERIHIGRHNVLAPAGTLAVVNPEECHDGEAGAEQGWAYRTFYPTVPLLTDVARELGHSEAPVFARPLIQDQALARAMARAHAGSMSADPTRAEASLLLALRGLILRHASVARAAEPVAQTGACRRLARYAALIEAELTNDIDLQRLAGLAGVTRFQVIRDFKREAGLTPAAYIRDRRLRAAARLIEQGAGLAEAAAASGFADQSHLSRTFRAIRGITPGAFRKAVAA